MLEAPDLAARNRSILVHLERMHQQLEQTQATVASLQGLLTDDPPAGAPGGDQAHPGDPRRGRHGRPSPSTTARRGSSRRSPICTPRSRRPGSTRPAPTARCTPTSSSKPAPARSRRSSRSPATPPARRRRRPRRHHRRRARPRRPVRRPRPGVRRARHARRRARHRRPRPDPRALPHRDQHRGVLARHHRSKRPSTTPHLASITFDCTDALAVGPLLVRSSSTGPSPTTPRSDYAQLAGEPAWSFMSVPEPKAAKNRVHVDLDVADLAADGRPPRRPRRHAGRRLRGVRLPLDHARRPRGQRVRRRRRRLTVPPTPAGPR